MTAGSHPRTSNASQCRCRIGSPRRCPATSATVRDATYVLDAILDNETELPIEEHATDTAGYTEVVCWNTVYMDAVVDQLRVQGAEVAEEDLVHLSPARSEHINPYGRYQFDLSQPHDLAQLRPLRQPGSAERCFLPRCYREAVRADGTRKPMRQPPGTCGSRRSTTTAASAGGHSWRSETPGMWPRASGRSWARRRRERPRPLRCWL